MEIISKTVEIGAQLPIDNEFIEAKLAEMDIYPLRWAITGIKGNTLTISLACKNS